MGVIAFFYVIILLFSSLISIAAYIINGFGIMNLSNKLKLKNGWMGFVPYASSFKLGQIADKVCELKGEKKNYSKLLLTLHIVLSALFIPLYMIAFIMGFVMGYGEIDFSPLPVIAFVIFSLVILGIAITLSIYVYIVHYKIYNFFSENNANLFIVLAILFGLQSLFIFIVSLKKEPVIIDVPFTANTEDEPVEAPEEAPQVLAESVVNDSAE